MRNAPSIILSNFIWIFLLICPVFSYAYNDNYPAFSTSGFLTKDGSLLVSEEFIFDFGDNPRHGIYRTMPLASDNSKRWYEMKNLEVRDQNKQELTFESETTGNMANVKIGNPNITLTGTHYYNVRYSLTNVGSDTEIDWRVLNPLREPIGKFEAKLYFPVLMRQGIASSTCNFIPQSPGGECVVRPIIKGDRVMGFVLDTNNLSNSEVHLNVKYPRGIVISNFVEKDNSIQYKKYIIITISILLVSIIAFVIYKFRNKIKSIYINLNKHAISPDEYSYLERAIYYYGEIKKEDIVATIADLSERGYLSLEQFAHPVGVNEFVDYSIEVLSDEIDNESEKILISLLQNVKSLSEWLSKNYDDSKPKLEEISKEGIRDIKLYRYNNEEIPTLVGFKIL